MSKEIDYARTLLRNLTSMGIDERKEFNKAINSLNNDDYKEFFNDIHQITIAIDNERDINKPEIKFVNEKLERMSNAEQQEFGKAIRIIYVAINNERDIPIIPANVLNSITTLRDESFLKENTSNMKFNK